LLVVELTVVRFPVVPLKVIALLVVALLVEAFEVRKLEDEPKRVVIFASVELRVAIVAEVRLANVAKKLVDVEFVIVELDELIFVRLPVVPVI
jgi:hypothetical protein